MEAIGVRFTKTGKIYYYQSQEAVPLHTYVLAPLQNCDYFGEVVVHKTVAEAPTAKITRLATKEDAQQFQLNRRDAKEAMPIAKRCVDKHHLEMKLINIEYSFHRDKMIFYFTADGRIDFRELVKNLAAIFKTRIELRQVGVRDEAKLLGGLGPCGRPLCCHQFLDDFLPVSIKMAKDQHLSLNPTKISGLCGRLMCCLKYENESYEEAKRRLPDIGTQVQTPDGKGVVVGLNILKELVQVRLKGKEVPLEYTSEEIQK